MMRESAARERADIGGGVRRAGSSVRRRAPPDEARVLERVVQLQRRRHAEMQRVVGELDGARLDLAEPVREKRDGRFVR
nr:hypothetical protein [Burkholderia pseudomallei]